MWRVVVQRRPDGYYRRHDVYAVRTCGTVVTGDSVEQVRRRERVYRERVGEVDWSAVEPWPDGLLDITDVRVRECRGLTVVNANGLRWWDVLRPEGGRVLRPGPLSYVLLEDGVWVTCGAFDRPAEAVERHERRLEERDRQPEPEPIAEEDLDAIAALG